MGFSMFFSAENDVVHHSSPYASVDCTLSLGTPSTRLCNDDDERRFSSHTSDALGWDFLNGSKKGGGGGGHNLLARRCTNCDTTSTPLWRNGPRGPKSLCNACGIRFKKEERRASTAGNSTSGGGSTAARVPTFDHQAGANYYYNNNNQYASSSPWVHHHQHNTQRIPYYSPANNEYSYVDDVRDVDHDVTTDPFLSWRLNLADRTSLVHDFTM
ncbi:zinc finger family protein [Arabidopsis lyrata subsp. lyrata]|uniref:Zinc finger family protein n=1 Tax=Arabidopsis lyrata subsp. lyrata TaxID=81972 RepID=D7MBG0_ARALL|nr:GATA transcription factor 19 [Arabidopsis lyrata subsp. lyrata]EFH43264.1 zinc finger family protein [Arabidopsis lyrata subsp. lyrata]|eukprot:XP_002867005.1 GATA transcription factor 19 [Arabidopsis lyrata subsp. lyrata]